MKKFNYLVLFLLTISNLNAMLNKEEVMAVKAAQTTSNDVRIDVKGLIEEATKAREKAYCPYSKFKVGSAILMDNGKIYTGANVENASYGLSNCAERTAIFKAVSFGDKKIIAVAIVLDAKEYGAPCGACRQVIHEFGKDAVVIMATVDGKHKIEAMPNLLTYAFNLE